MTERMKSIVLQGDVYIIEYILNECAHLLIEQRKMNVQIKLRKSLDKIRGKQLTKNLLVEFNENINKINFIETIKVKEFKQNIQDIIQYYNTYYTDDGKQRDY